MNQRPCHGATVHLVRGHLGQLQRVITLIQKSKIIIFLCSSSSACPYKKFSLAHQTLLPKEGKSLVKAVLGSCTAWPYLAALHFDNQLCNCGPQFVYKPHYTYHVGASCRAMLLVVTHIGLVVWVILLCKHCAYHCQTMNIPAVQLANTTFTRQSGV